MKEMKEMVKTIKDTEKENRQVKVHISGESENPTRMNLRSGKFKMIIDEPEPMGGTNQGPSPVQVLLMALAGCLNVTGHQVAGERGLKLKKMKIIIDGDMNPCTFMGCSYESRAGFQDIRVKVYPVFEEPLPKEMIHAWLEETEARCPVTDNIKTATHIGIENM